MITDLDVREFPHKVTIHPGDSLGVIHRTPFSEHTLSNYTVEEETELTHSILFRLNGAVNLIVGTQDTVEWLKRQCSK